MIAVDDLLTLPYTSDLTESGIAYACRAISYTSDRMGQSRFEHLRKMVAGVAVELAFRRYLHAQEVPFEILDATPITDPDRVDLAIAGRRCDLVSYLIFDRQRIREVRRDPGMILTAPALVAADEATRGQLRYEDLYIFAFLNALVTPDPETLTQAVAAEQSHYIMHPMPGAWALPGNWRSLGRLVMKGDLDAPVTIEVGGLNRQREFQHESVELAPRKRIRLDNDYYSLAYLQISEPPHGRIGVHSPAMGETYLVGQEEWGNIWVYGLEIILTGYMRWGEFRRKARRLPPGSQVLQSQQTHVENMAVPIRDLLSIGDLITRGKNWARMKGR